MEPNEIIIIIPYKWLLIMTLCYCSIFFFVLAIKESLVKKTHLNAPHQIFWHIKSFDDYRSIFDRDMEKSIWEIYKRYKWSKQFTTK